MLAQGFLDLFFGAAPHLGDFFQIFELSTKLVTKAAFAQRNAKGTSGKGPRQKSSKSVKNIFDTFRHFSRRAKNVKNRQKMSKIFSTFFDNFRAAPVFRPLLGASDLLKRHLTLSETSAVLGGHPVAQLLAQL